jgi:hypothetical protein
MTESCIPKFSAYVFHCIPGKNFVFVRLIFVFRIRKFFHLVDSYQTSTILHCHFLLSNKELFLRICETLFCIQLFYLVDSYQVLQSHISCVVMYILYTVNFAT